MDFVLIRSICDLWWLQSSQRCLCSHNLSRVCIYLHQMISGQWNWREREAQKAARCTLGFGIIKRIYYKFRSNSSLFLFESRSGLWYLLMRWCSPLTHFQSSSPITKSIFQRTLFMYVCERASEWLSMILNGFGQSELTSNQRHMKCFQNLNTVRYRFSLCEWVCVCVCILIDLHQSPFDRCLDFSSLPVSQSQSIASLVSRLFWCFLSFAFSFCSFFSVSHGWSIYWTFCMK